MIIHIVVALIVLVLLAYTLPHYRERGKVFTCRAELTYAIVTGALEDPEGKDTSTWRRLIEHCSHIDKESVKFFPIGPKSSLLGLVRLVIGEKGPAWII